MSRRGPKPEPASVKEAKGNPSRRPIGKDPENSVGIQAAKVEAPKWLKREGLAVWKRLAPKLIGIKILTSVDAETFARYCNNFGRWIKLQKCIADEGEYYSTDTGFTRPHAAMIIVIRLEAILERAEDRFGLNPAERQRLFAARAAQGSAPDLFSQEQNEKPDTPVSKNVDLEKIPALGALN